MVRPQGMFVGWARPRPVLLVSSRYKLKHALPDLSWSPVPNRCSKAKKCQIEPQQRTSGLTGQHPRISVSTSHTSVQSHCDRPSIVVPGPLPYALAHLTGNAQSCAREHGHAMHGSSVVRLRSPCEVARQLFLPLR
jgi:hypothetical protein